MPGVAGCWSTDAWACCRILLLAASLPHAWQSAGVGCTWCTVVCHVGQPQYRVPGLMSTPYTQPRTPPTFVVMCASASYVCKCVHHMLH